jgi:ribosome-interacting GTPase 1
LVKSHPNLFNLSNNLSNANLIKKKLKKRELNLKKKNRENISIKKKKEGGKQVNLVNFSKPNLK